MNNQTQEALKMAIEAIEIVDAIVWEYGGVPYEKLQSALQVCKEALEQPAQEPLSIEFNKIHELFINVWNREISADDALYEIEGLITTHPAQPLSDEVLINLSKIILGVNDSLVYEDDVFDFARAIEQAHGIGVKDD